MKLIYIVCITILLLIETGCDEYTTDPKNNVIEKWNGQVVSEWVGAILMPDSTIWTWGPNFYGTLGNGTMDNSEYPTQVVNINKAVSIDFYCGAAFAVDDSGNIWFWGNYFIWVGNPNIDTNVIAPIKISFLKNMTNICAWGSRINLLTRDGTVSYMLMKTEAPEIYEGPIYSGLNNIDVIHRFSALGKDGNIYQLGTNELLTNAPKNAKMIQSTLQRNVVLKNDGTVWAWGKNDLGQLGNGTFEDSKIPTQVKNISNIVDISANYDFNLALNKDGAVWFWGFTGSDGDSLRSINVPEKIEQLNNIVLIYAASKCLVMNKDGIYWTFSVEDRNPEQLQFN